MPPWDAHALLRPPFTAAEFTATEFHSAEDKAKFANALCRFIAAGCPERLWTKPFYRRLNSTFGMIAHCNRHGFWEEFFTDARSRLAFIQRLRWYCVYGHPGFTWGDVEQAVQARLRASGALEPYRAVLEAEVERTERATLDRLRAKYDDAPPPPADPPQPFASARAAKPSRKGQGEGRQGSLI